MLNKYWKGLMHYSSFGIFFLSFLFLTANASDPLNQTVPFRVLSWSINDGIVIVEHKGEMVEMKKQSVLAGTFYRLRSIEHEIVTFSGDETVGEIFRISIAPNSIEQKVQRITLLPASK